METKKIKILIIDDDTETRNMYVEIFKKNNFEVEEAADGMEGLEKILKNIPDVVFSGIAMPRMDGLSLIENLKKNVATSQIPIVISSHLGKAEDEKKAREMGAKDFIVRYTTTPVEVVERIKLVLSSSAYKLKVVTKELDAEKLAADIAPGGSSICSLCGGEMALSLKVVHLPEKIFKVEFICTQCKTVKN
jgi:DNA-binding response OmpR family regulator